MLLLRQKLVLQLFGDKSKANEAAKAMKVDAESLIKFGLIDEVISEPLGGAHRDLGGSCHLISNSIEKP